MLTQLKVEKAVEYCVCPSPSMTNYTGNGVESTLPPLAQNFIKDPLQQFPALVTLNNLKLIILLKTQVQYRRYF